ncbi:MAG TPA: ATP-binding protein [Polyangia bacterium]|nr:ATP-binding protein [Polyangia bacterium]
MGTLVQPRLSSAGRPRALGVGLSVIVVILIVEAIVDARLTRKAEGEARRIALDSILSVEVVDRIVRAVTQQRVLVDDHIEQVAPASMVEVERRLAEADHELAEAERQYAQLVDLPNEASTWLHIQSLLARFDVARERMLSLSRQNRDREARTELRSVRAEYQDIDHSFEELIRINRVGAADSMNRIETLRREADDAVLGLRIIELLALALLGWWGARRIAAYETQILDYARRLEDRNDNLDAFAGRVAHDLKNTLAPTFMSPALLRRSAGNQARVLEIADTTERCSVRAVAVVDALLAFSRASHEVVADESGAVRFAVKEVTDELSPLVLKVGASIEVQELPDAQVRCSQELLHIALANVVGNAVKYLERRSERQVRISAHTDGAWCRIDVADTGPGIRKSDQEKIFEPFYRVEGSEVPGTGIGLATVCRIVQTRGGRVTLDSVEGQGSLFHIFLPLVKPPQDRLLERPVRRQAARA